MLLYCLKPVGEQELDNPRRGHGVSPGGVALLRYAGVCMQTTPAATIL